MKYSVIVPKPVQKQLDNLPDIVHHRVVEQISRLAENPRPLGAIKLKGYESEYRIRISDYRVSYEDNNRCERTELATQATTHSD